MLTAERLRHGELHEIQKNHLKSKCLSTCFTSMNHHALRRVKNCSSVELRLNSEKVKRNRNALSHTKERASILPGRLQHLDAEPKFSRVRGSLIQGLR